MKKRPSLYLAISRHLLTMTCLLGSIASLPAFAAHTLVDLGANVVPQDINNNGIVVGSRNTTAYPPSAFVYDSATGTYTDLDGTIAYAVNDNGTVAGNTLTGAFVWDATSFRTWDEQGAYGISETGLVSGNVAGKNPYRTTSTPYNPAVYNGSKWDVMDIAQVYPRGTRQGVYADIYLLDDVNDAGYAVGSRRRYGLVGSSAILITPPYNTINDASDVSYLPIPSGGVATAINDRNIVVGTTGNNSRVGDYAAAFIFDANNSVLTLLEPLPGGQRSSGLDINDDGTVVGSSETDTVNHAFLLKEGDNVITDLNELVDEPDWVLVSAAAINEHGDIVGTGQFNGQNHGFLLVNGDAPPPPQPENQAPMAIVSTDGPTSGRAPLTVHLTGAESFDPDGSIVAYSWDCGDGTDLFVSSGPDAQCTYNLAGTYVIVLTVTDNDGRTSEGAPLDIKVRGKK